MQPTKHSLSLKRLGICTYKEAVIYISHKSYLCASEGFETQSRIKVAINNHSIVATLNIITSNLLKPNEASLSEYAFELLGAKEGDEVFLSHLEPLVSSSFIRGKIFGREFTQTELHNIIDDVVKGHLSDMQIAAFLSACAGNKLTRNEIVRLTKAMLDVGSKITWPNKLIVDKHSIGGLPGNKTTMIVVPIIAAFGLTIPKTSSRAITSAAGTADTMEVLAPVELTFDLMQKVISHEGGCIVWGGTSALSPADDILIRVERALNLNGEGQMVASVLSKKLASGATYLVLDMPLGPTAKIRDQKQARRMKNLFAFVGKKLGIKVKTCFTNGNEPVGFGIGPALEAQDVLDVLQNKPAAPQDLKEKSLFLAGQILEFAKKAARGQGRHIAEEILVSGKAWKKMQAICKAQGGMRDIPKAPYKQDYVAKKSGTVALIDNRRIARIAKLAGAPHDKAAGVYLHKKLHAKVKINEPILTLHAESRGELNYALNYLLANEKEVVAIS